MRPNRLYNVVRGGGAAIGGWVAFSDPASAEVMARSGFDFLMVDGEHCPLTIQHIHSILLAIQQTDVGAVVRPLGKHPDFIKQVLDLGADGVMVPQVNTVAEAQTAVQAAKYHPLGNRAFGPVRVGGYWTEPDYLKTANDYHILILQIETPEGLKNMPEILKVQGVDAVFFGHGDYSQASGHLGELDHPEVLAAEDQFYALAREAGMPAGTIARNPESFGRCLEKGARLAVLRADISYVFAGAKQDVADSRKILEQRR